MWHLTQGRPLYGTVLIWLGPAREGYVWDSAKLFRAPQGRGLFGTVLICLGPHRIVFLWDSANLQKKEGCVLSHH